MSKELTEKWKNGILETGDYWCLLDTSSCIGEPPTQEQVMHWEDGFEYNEDLIIDILNKVPSYEEYQSLLSDQLAKNEGVEINAELEAENKKLKEQLEEANDILKCYGECENWCSSDGDYIDVWGYEEDGWTNAKEYLNEWGVK